MDAHGPVRVRLSGTSAVFPRLCACCLLSLEDLPPAQEQAALAASSSNPLGAPWCEDCRRHALMRRVERALRLVARVAGVGAAALLAASFVPGLPRLPRIFLWVSVLSLLLLAGGLAAFLRLRLEDRKESCAAQGVPVRAAGPAGEGSGGLTLECDNPDFASLLVEANPGASKERPAPPGVPPPPDSANVRVP